MCAAMLLVHALETTSTCASKQELCFNVNTQNRRERTKIKPYKVEKKQQNRTKRRFENDLFSRSVNFIRNN